MKKMFRIGLCLMAVAVLAMTGCSLSSQVLDEVWEGEDTFEMISQGTMLVTGDFTLTFTDEKNFTAVLMNGAMGSTTVYSTRTGTYTIDGKTISFTTASQVDKTTDYVNSTIINATWAELDIFPVEGKSSEALAIKTGKYMLVYDGLFITTKDGKERTFTAAK